MGKQRIHERRHKKNTDDYQKIFNSCSFLQAEVIDQRRNERNQHQP